MSAINKLVVRRPMHKTGACVVGYFLLCTFRAY